jgi:uncharacterized protein (DUF2461 family)
LQGERLTRAPKGFSPDHPAFDLLRHKHFVAWFERPAAFAETPDLFLLVLEGFVSLMPLIRYLNAALKVAARLPD